MNIRKQRGAFVVNFSNSKTTQTYKEDAHGSRLTI